MNSDLPFRAKAGIYTLAGIALLTGLIALKNEVTQYSTISGQSEIPSFDQRFAGLRRLLPPNGIAGYLADRPFGDMQTKAEYYLAQYSLAPVVIVNNDDQRLVVGNFHTPTPDPSIYKSRGLEVVTNLGNGAWLFRRAGK